MKQFSEEENNLKCKFKNKKNWWEIKLKLDMKTHLFCSKHLAKEKYLFECKWKGKACICSDYLICSLSNSEWVVLFAKTSSFSPTNLNTGQYIVSLFILKSIFIIKKNVFLYVK